jgi:hypothetical protein
VAAAVVFLALAGLSSLPFDGLGFLPVGPAAGLFLSDLALFSLAHARVGKRMGACALLFLGQRAEDDAGRLGGWRSGRLGGRRCGRFRGRNGLGNRRRRGLSLDGVADGAALFRLDHNLLGASMAEALLDDIRLAARLQRESRFAGADAQLLFARIFRLSHSVP